jgi:hypothetical protein
MSIKSAAAARICACTRSRLGSPRSGIPEHRMTARRSSRRLAGTLVAGEPAPHGDPAV